MEYAMDVIMSKKGLLLNIKENFYISIHKEALTSVDGFRVLCFTASGASPAVRCV
jgi:hypothetical protein